MRTIKRITVKAPYSTVSHQKNKVDRQLNKQNQRYNKRPCRSGNFNKGK